MSPNVTKTNPATRNKPETRKSCKGLVCKTVQNCEKQCCIKSVKISEFNIYKKEGFRVDQTLQTTAPLKCHTYRC